MREITAERAEALHHSSIIVDGHCDAPFRLHRHRLHLDQADPTAQVDLASLVASGVSASFFAAYVPAFYASRRPALFADRLIDLIETEVNLYPEQLVLASDSDGILHAKAEGKVAIMIGIEGGHAIEDSLERLEYFYRRGVRYLTLTHVNSNNWADSSGDGGRHGGLTSFGREVVGLMNELGMIVDVSHVADSTFYDVLDTTRAPVIASHSSCRALAPHPRNLTDAMLRDLASIGGVCMINFFTAFVSRGATEVLLAASPRSRPEELPPGDEEEVRDRREWEEYCAWFSSLGCPPARLDDVVDHIVHAGMVAGIEHVGIGSDFDGVPALPAGLENVRELPALTKRMLERGFSDEEVRGVLGENFVRTFTRIEEGAAASDARRDSAL